MEELKKDIQALVTDLQVRVVSVTWLTTEGKKILEVAIDSPQGVDMDLCAKVSNTISELLDTAVNQEGYYLDVCSSGTERALESEEELVANLGKYVEASFKEAIKGIMKFRGYLEKNGDNYCLNGFIKGRKTIIEFAYQDLEKIHLTVKI